MKVGILTFHNTLNYGAQLQLYALYTVLKEKGHDVEVVNYSNKMVLERETPRIPSAVEWIEHPRGSLRLFWAYPVTKTRKLAFNRFESEYLKISESIKHERELTDRYDVIVVGSDQIWNPGCTGGDLTYFLYELPKPYPRRIAYAASFGSGSFPIELSEICGNALRNFDAISVREKEGIQIVKDLSSRSAMLTLDPTLLLEKSQWDDLAGDRIVSDKYVFAYVVSERTSTLAFAKRLAKARRAKLIALDCYHGRRSAFGVTYLNAVSPEEFLSLIRYADSVVTSSFHGMALALAMEKDMFYVLNGKADNRNSRLETLASLAGIENRNISYGKQASSINYFEVRNKIACARQKSLEFLDTSLN